MPLTFSMIWKMLGDLREVLPGMAGVWLGLWAWLGAGMGMVLAAGDLSENSRILRLTAPGLEDHAYREQAALLLPEWQGLIERDVVVVVVFRDRPFQVELIGKDGGIKLTQAVPITPRALFELIDAMPMRRAEKQRRSP